MTSVLKKILRQKDTVLSGQLKLGVLALAAFALVSCETTPIQDIPSASDSVAPLSQSEQINSVASNSQSTAGVTQIGVASSDYAARQINRDVNTPQLTVDQLKAYADRCAPGRAVIAADIDCSELSLRVKRVFRSDDKIADALITLDRLGRNDSSDNIDDELGRNRGDLSYSAQAIASGALDAPPPTLPVDPTVSPELESFLNEIGLGVNAGAIVRPGG